MRRVEVSPYQVRWMSTFEEEADRLRQTFGDEVVDIHHIGSTSVVVISPQMGEPTYE